MNKEIKIYETNIRIGNSVYISQPKEIIDYIEKQQEKLDKINNISKNVQMLLKGNSNYKDIISNELFNIQKIINEEE